MKIIPLLCWFVLLPGWLLSQNRGIDYWVSSLQDESSNQFIRHYGMYREIQQLDTAARRKLALDIAEACNRGDNRLKLLGRSVKAKLLFYASKPFDSAYAAQMKNCLTEAIETDEPYLQA